jgi:hypothetical protein
MAVRYHYNKAHKVTQTIKDTLHTINITYKKKSKDILVIGCAGL